MPDAAPSSPPVPWRLILLLGALTAFGPVSIDLYLPALPDMTADLRASASEGQASVATFFAGMAVGQFLYGPGSDRFGRKPPLLIGITLYLVATAVCALATSPAMLIGARFAQALGACSGMVIARAIVRDRFDHHETAKVLSLLTLVMGLAPILAPFFGGLVLQVAGWRMIFWMMAIFGVTIGLATLLTLTESLTDEGRALARSETVVAAFARLITHRRLVGYVLAASLNGAALFSYVAASPEIVIGLYHVPKALFGLVFGANAIGIIGAGQVNRLLLRRYTSDEILARASLAAVASAVLLAFSAITGIGGAWTVLPLLFAALASYGFMSSNTMAGALSVDPLRSGSISALIGGAAFGVGAAAAAISGAFHDGTAGPLAITMLVALSGSALSLYGLALRKAS